MTQLSHRLTNLVARSLRGVRRALAPNLDTRRFALGRAYGQFVHAAARLDYVDGVNGHRMYLDDRDSLRLSVARIFEPAETRFFQAAIKPGDVVVDVGGNIGYFTLLFARCATEAGHVITFEPDPTNFGLLQRNVTLNGYGNVTLHNRALWSEPSELRLYLSESNRGDHQTYPSADARDSVAIEAVRLDDVLPDGQRVDFVKMDIQGAEFHALRGMTRTLEQNRSVRLVTELWPAGLARSGGSAAAYLDMLGDLGFAFFTLSEEGDAPAAVAKATLLARAEAAPDDFMNVLCQRVH